MNIWRVILGFALAPVAPSFVIVPLLAIVTGAGREILPVMGGWTFLAAFFTVPATLLLGVPLFLLFRWRGWTSWRHSGALG